MSDAPDDERKLADQAFGMCAGGSIHADIAAWTLRLYAEAKKARTIKDELLAWCREQGCIGPETCGELLSEHRDGCPGQVEWIVRRERPRP